MEIKTKHEKYANYKTKKQLAEEGLMPSGKGVELWTNGSCSATAIYYDATKATKITELYIGRITTPVTMGLLLLVSVQ